MAKQQQDTEPMGIFAAITKIMAELEPITKERKGPQGWTFRGIDDCYNALHPLLAKYGVFVVPQVVEMKRSEVVDQAKRPMIFTTLTVCHRFYAADGSSVDAITAGEAFDVSDKSTAKAHSMAMKQAFFIVFAIPTGEPTDNEAQDLRPAPNTANITAELKPLAEVF